MEYEFIIENEKHTFECEVVKNICNALIEGKEHHYEFSLPCPNRISLQGDNDGYTVYFVKNKDSIHLFLEGEKYILKIPESASEFSGEADSLAGTGLVETPMPGTIIKFLVEEGDEVEMNQTLVIVEAMKMENEIRASMNAIVKKINFQPGDAVDIGQSIIDLEAVEKE